MPPVHMIVPAGFEQWMDWEVLPLLGLPEVIDHEFYLQSAGGWGITGFQTCPCVMVLATFNAPVRVPAIRFGVSITLTSLTLNDLGFPERWFKGNFCIKEDSIAILTVTGWEDRGSDETSHSRTGDDGAATIPEEPLYNGCNHRQHSNARCCQRRVGDHPSTASWHTKCHLRGRRKTLPQS
ncbi:hypothetical protein J6590_044949 [Homalodisca vitripennis]|nr:hypothetical protein J6590_044949 [Homalodisca vitripennis]